MTPNATSVVFDVVRQRTLMKMIEIAEVTTTCSDGSEDNGCGGGTCGEPATIVVKAKSCEFVHRETFQTIVQRTDQNNAADDPDEHALLAFVFF